MMKVKKRYVYKKKGKKRAKKRLGKLSIARWPRKDIISDQLRCTLPIVTEFHSVGAWGTAGAMALFNVCGNNLYLPFNNPAVGPTFTVYTAAVGGAGGSFAGVANAAYPAATAASPSFYTSLTDLYRNWHVVGSKITVEVILSNANDECDLIILPVSQANDTAAYAAMEARYSKFRQIAYYQGGTRGENKLSNSMTTRKLFGINTPAKYLMDDVNNNGAVTTPPSTYVWAWEVGCANKFSNAAAGTASFKVTVHYDTIFFNPKFINV